MEDTSYVSWPGRNRAVYCTDSIGQIHCLHFQPMALYVASVKSQLMSIRIWLARSPHIVTIWSRKGAAATEYGAVDETKYAEGEASKTSELICSAIVLMVLCGLLDPFLNLVKVEDLK